MTLYSGENIADDGENIADDVERNDLLTGVLFGDSVVCWKFDISSEERMPRP